MKAFKAGSPEGCFVQMDIGSEDRLALNLQCTQHKHGMPCRPPAGSAEAISLAGR